MSGVGRLFIFESWNYVIYFERAKTELNCCQLDSAPPPVFENHRG